MKMQILDSNFNVLAEHDNPHRDKVRTGIYRIKKIDNKKHVEIKIGNFPIQK